MFPDNKVAICYIIWLPIALPGFCITCRNSHSSAKKIQRGFSCAQCNAYLLYCVRNKQPARSRAVNIHFWSDSIASSCGHLFAWKFFPEWIFFVVSINVPPPQLWGGEHSKLRFNHVRVFSQSVTCIRLLKPYNIIHICIHSECDTVNTLWYQMAQTKQLGTCTTNKSDNFTMATFTWYTHTKTYLIIDYLFFYNNYCQVFPSWLTVQLLG